MLKLCKGLIKVRRDTHCYAITYFKQLAKDLKSAWM